jgi:uncharacterized protein with von Willebrand factor type A (vWA) domain
MWNGCDRGVFWTVSEPFVSDGRSATAGGRLGNAVIDRLGALGAALRTQGSRVGMGELLTAHRALAAVDCTSREDARLALRAVLCSDRGDLARFERAFLAVP